MNKFSFPHVVSGAIFWVTVVAAVLVSFLGAPAQSSAQIEAHSGWLRPTPPSIDVTAFYVRLRNTGSKPERLMRISSPVAEVVEIHHVVETEGMLLMQPVAGGVVIEAGGELLLAPGGYHAMLIGLRRQIALGDRIPLQLHFAGGTIVDITAQARHTADSGGGHNH